MQRAGERFAALATSFAVVAAGALLLGCFGVVKQARQVREGLVGMPARALWNCLGDPYHLQLDREPELWAFQLPLPEFGPQEVGFQISTSPGTAFMRPQVFEGNPEEGDPNKRMSMDSDMPPGRCRVVAEVYDGVVRAIHFQGRTNSNMNADVECAIVAKRCLPGVE